MSIDPPRRPSPPPLTRDAGALARLLDLLDDPSPRVWREVRRSLLTAGRRARPALERELRGSNARRRARARQALLDQAREREIRRLVRYASREDLDLETGSLLLGRVGSPGLDLRPYRLALDAMGARYRRKLESKGREDPATLLSDYLAGELGYGGREEDIHHPDHAFLPRAIERKVGLPLTLCVLYYAVARRAGIVTGILPLPGHVLLRVHSGGRSTLIDPFHDGEPRTEDHCLVYLAMHELPFRSSWFQDAPAHAMLRRQIVNAEDCWRRRGLHVESHSLARARRALAQRGR